MRSETEGTLVSNSTLMVQAFFLMSSFLLANKLLQQRRRQERLRVCSTIVETMVNRVVR
jgi:peptidoglycan/LPS O-acetylase OafA/YrhL